MRRKKQKSKYVLYGFCKADIEDVGYLIEFPKDAEDIVITDDLDAAMRFDESNVDSAVKYVNDEFKDIYGPYAYVFHKVKVIS